MENGRSVYKRTGRESFCTGVSSHSAHSGMDGYSIWLLCVLDVINDYNYIILATNSYHDRKAELLL